MAGTREGSKKSAATIKREYGDDFYQKIGRIGGKNGNKGGFAGNSARAREAGAKGGRIGKRGYYMLKDEYGRITYLPRS